MLLESRFIEVLCALNQPKARVAPTIAIEWLLHVPFRAWIEKCNIVTLLQRFLVHNADFILGHVEDDARAA